MTDYNEDVGTVTSVDFGIMSPQRIRQFSVCEVYRQINNSQVEGTPFDPRMGPTEKDVICPTCKHTYIKCPGHYGRIELPYPVVVPQFYQYILKIADMFCYKCSGLICGGDDDIGVENRKKIESKKQPDVRFNYINKVIKKRKHCPHCGTVCIKFKKYPQIPLGFAREEVQTRSKSTSTDAGKKEVTVVSNYDIFNMFKRISDADCHLIGLNPETSRPEWMFWTVMLVPPTSVRPSVKNDDGRPPMDDDLIFKINEIIKEVVNIREKIESDVSVNTVDNKDVFTKLQYSCITFVDNSITTVQTATHRNGRPIKAIRQRIGSKDGRFRSNTMGKRVDLSARTVITPDPYLSIDQVGVPKEIAMNLTYPEPVTEFNYKKLQTLIQKPQNEWPSVKSIKSGKRGTKKNLKIMKLEDRMKIVLQIGDIVYRHLMDDDYVVFNRQPSLHKMSMMGHRAKIHDGRSFMFNQNVTEPYAGDFDGDEMNLHIPVSCQTVVEIRLLVSVPTQILTPQKSAPSMGFVQDSTYGLYALSKNGNKIRYDEVMRLVSVFRHFDGNLPSPAGYDEYINRAGKQQREPYWKACQIISIVMPFINYYHPSGVNIINGVVQDKSVFSKKTVGKASGSLFHATWNDFGPLRTRDLMDDLSMLAIEWLQIKGFSCGVDDCELEESSLNEITNIIDKTVNQTNELISNVKAGICDNPSKQMSEIPIKLTIMSGQCSRDVESFIKQKGVIKPNNRIKSMFDAGSKGKISDINQTISMLGSQVIDGELQGNGLYRRANPYCPKDSLSIIDHGFVRNSFRSGLTPDEYFNHAASGRDGVISKGIKTAEPGYIQRKFIKSMEGVHVAYDGTVRNENGVIVQFVYGDDGFDATFHEEQRVPFMMNSVAELYTNYATLSMDYVNEHYNDINDVENIENIKNKLKYEIEKIADYHSYFRGRVYNRKSIPNTIMCPVNFERNIKNVAGRFKLVPNSQTDLSPVYVVDEIIKLRSKIVIDKFSFDESIVDNDKKGLNYLATVAFNSLMATNMCYKNLSSLGYTKMAFDHLITTIYTGYLRALVNPKEAVGVIAAQSLGEPTTQMALDAFHNLGSGEEGELSTGIPKLKELIGISKNPKTPSIKICLKKSSTLNGNGNDGNVNTKVITLQDRVEHVKKIANTIEHITIGQLLNKSTIAFKTDANEEDPIFKSYQTYGIDIPSNCWTILLEFNRNLLAKKFVSMIELQTAIQNNISHVCSGVEVLIVDDNSKNLVIKMVFKTNFSESSINPLHFLKLIQQQLNNSKVKGIEGIEKCGVKAVECDIIQSDGSVIPVSDETKYGAQAQKDYQFYIQTIGSSHNSSAVSNYSDILNLPDVDPYYTTSNNVWDVYEIYGIEAARACLLKELNDVMSSNNISPRHLDCLISIMTNQGILISIDRYGVSKGQAGLWVRASFEETVTQITKGSVFGEKDLMTGPSGNIMFGQIVKSGTGGFKVGIDSVRLRSAEFKPVPSVFKESDDELVINEVNGECATECFDFTYKWD